MKMNLHKIFIPCRNQAVSFKMFGDVIPNLILIQILISTVNQKLRIVAICELIVLCINTMYF